jgi:tRNA U38,U39,U40 pseudouridine synthase TruA
MSSLFLLRKVVTFQLRSKVKEGKGIISLPKVESKLEFGIEESYLRILNSNLPSSIRVLAWSPVSDTFSARFCFVFFFFF